MSHTKTYSITVGPTVIGDYGDTLTPPSTTQPTVTIQDDVVFTLPFTSPTLTVTLRCPEFDNHQYTQFRRTYERSLGGTLVIRRTPTNYKLTRLALVFRSLTKDESDDLYDFVKASLGREIGYRDHENRQWRGYIASPGETVNSEGECSFSYQIEFQGRLA
jgi:hypothetical protein